MITRWRTLVGCPYALNPSLDTVKRYDGSNEPERLKRVPKYRPSLVEPHRDRQIGLNYQLTVRSDSEVFGWPQHLHPALA